MQGREAMSRICLIGLTAVLAASGGCALFEDPMTPGVPWMPGDQGAIESPVRVSCVWSDAVMHRSGEKAKRGVGARVFFYRHRNESADPVKVKGQFEIYVFEEDDADADISKPEHKFVFSAEQFANHHIKDDLGHSYNVFVPYDDAGRAAQADQSDCAFHSRHEGRRRDSQRAIDARAAWRGSTADCSARPRDIALADGKRRPD